METRNQLSQVWGIHMGQHLPCSKPCIPICWAPGHHHLQLAPPDSWREGQDSGMAVVAVMKMQAIRAWKQRSAKTTKNKARSSPTLPSFLQILMAFSVHSKIIKKSERFKAAFGNLPISQSRPRAFVNTCKGSFDFIFPAQPLTHSDYRVSISTSFIRGSSYS